MMLEVKVRRTDSTCPGTPPSRWWALWVVVEVLVWSEKGAVSIDTLTSSYCLSRMRQQFLRASTALDRRTHFARTPAASSDSCPSPEHLLNQYHEDLAPGRRARSREGHTKERTAAHDTGEIDCKQEELEVPMGTSHLVPSRGTCRAPIWTRAHAP